MVVVFGCRGQLASSLKSTTLGASASFLGSDVADFLQTDVVEILNRLNPQVIINAAAYTNVDRAEVDRKNAERVNAITPGLIADWAARHNRSLIHFSTDYIFSGGGARAWKIDDQPEPVNWYGSTKLDGEKRIRESGAHHVILRTSWLYSAHGHNFLRTMLRLNQTHSYLSVVADQHGSPTFARDVAQFVDQAFSLIAARRVQGTFHVVNEGTTTWHGFASEIFRQIQSMQGDRLTTPVIKAVSSKEFPTIARRPLNSCLDTTQTLSTFPFRMPSWTDALRRCLLEIEADNAH